MAHVIANSMTPFVNFGLFSINSVALLIEKSRQRRALATMDNHILEDIGVSQKEAWEESRRAFWDIR